MGGEKEGVDVEILIRIITSEKSILNKRKRCLGQRISVNGEKMCF